MAYPHNQNEKLLVANFVDDAINTDTDAIQIVRSLQLQASLRSRIVSESFDCRDDALHDFLGKLL